MSLLERLQKEKGIEELDNKTQKVRKIINYPKRRSLY